MKVAHVVDSLALGGAERIAVDLANELAARSVDVVVSATRHGGPLAEDLDDRVELVVIGRRRRWDVDGLRRFASAMDERGVDLVHSHGWSSMQLVSLVRTLRLLRAKHVFHDHSPHRIGMPTRRFTEALPMKLAVDAYVGVDERLVSRALQVLPVSRVTFRRNWVNPLRFDVPAADLRGAFQLADCDLIAVVVANVHRIKDHVTFLRALASTRAVRIGAVLVGETASDPQNVVRVRRVIEELGLQDRVRLAGSRSDVPALLRGSDIGVLSSLEESGPLAVVEYLAGELPVVCTDTGDLIEAIRAHGIARIVPPGDAVALGDAIEEVARLSPEARQRLGQEGRLLVERELGVGRAVDAMIALYETVLGRRLD